MMNRKMTIRQKGIGWRLLRAAFLLLLVFRYSLSTSSAQGLPQIRNYTATEYHAHNVNYDIAISDDGTVFVANFEGILYYDRAQWRIVHAPDINRATVIYRDSKNTIWAGGYDFMARLQRRANGELCLQQVNRPGQFEGEVMEIFEHQGELLFVVSDDNIYEVRHDSVSLKKGTNANFKYSPNRAVISVKNLLEGRQDVILNNVLQTLTLDGGIQVQVRKDKGLAITDANGRELYTITEANGLCSDQVSYVAYDHHGLLWGATAHGIFAIELPSVYSYILPKDGLSGEVQAIAAFDGQIYVGGTNGLYSITARRCKRLVEVNNICWTLCPDRDAMLAATSSGIYKIARGGAVSRMTSHSTTALLIDGDKVYAGESEGVYVYQSDFRQRSEVNHLPLVTAIRRNAQGDLWFKNVYGKTLGTEPAAAKAPLDELPSHLAKPLSDIDVTTQYRDDRLTWIGGDEILAVVDTSQKELVRLTDCRTIRFRSVTMDGDSVLWGGFGEMPATLPRLGSDECHLKFSYALDYAPLTGKTLYRYRLNHDRWSVWSENQSVEFLNLSYGAYTLSVQAQLANGELSDVASVDFAIAYPLLMRWYMVVLYFIAFAYLIYLLFRFRLKKLQKDKIKLERIVEERTADLRNAQQELIRHEKMASVGKLTEGLIDRILNPMNYIINFSKMSIDLLKDLKDDIGRNKENINEDDYQDTEDVLGMLTDNLTNVDHYGQNASHMLKAMEEMLKDRTGGYLDMDLRIVLQQSEQMFDSYFAKEKAQYGIQTVFTLPNDAMLIHGNPDMLNKTVMNMLSNAVYAVVRKAQRTDFQPEISLVASMAEGCYVLKIRDNGIGIEETIIGKVFDPFFTTKTTDEGTGIGLYLGREIVQNHGGDISVVSVKDDYTEFTVTLPKLQEKR